MTTDGLQLHSGRGGGQGVSNKMKAGGGGSTGVSLFRVKIFLLLNSLMFEGLIKVLLTGLKPGGVKLKHTARLF